MNYMLSIPENVDFYLKDLGTSWDTIKTKLAKYRYNRDKTNAISNANYELQKGIREGTVLVNVAPVPEADPGVRMFMSFGASSPMVARLQVQSILYAVPHTAAILNGVEGSVHGYRGEYGKAALSMANLGLLYLGQQHPEALLEKMGTDKPIPAMVEAENATQGNGAQYLGPFYKEAKSLSKIDPEFFPNPDTTNYSVTTGAILESERTAFIESGLRGHHRIPIAHGGPAIPPPGGLVFTGESTISASQLRGLDLSFYTQYGSSSAKMLKIFQSKPDGIILFGLNPRHTRASSFWNTRPELASAKWS